MTEMIAYPEKDIEDQYNQLLPLFYSFTENIPCFGKSSKAKRHLEYVFSKLKIGTMIDRLTPLKELSYNSLLHLLFKNLHLTKMKHYFLSDSAHPCTEAVLEVMNQLLPEKDNFIKSTEIPSLIKKIEAITSKIESDPSIVNYAKAGLKLMLVIALGCAAVLCVYACIASLGLLAVSFFTGPLAFIAVGVSISLTLTFAGLGISALGTGLKFLKSSFDDAQNTYIARNPTEKQKKALEDQNKILDAIKSKLSDALDQVPSDMQSMNIKLDYTQTD